MKRRIVAIAAMVSVITGCASPVVRYVPIDGVDSEGLAKFQFAESLIKFDYAKTASGVQIPDSIVISSVPIPFGDKKFGIAGTSWYENWGVTTTVNVSFRGDSTLIQQLSVTVTDQRIQAIQALGAIAGAVGGLMSLSPDTTKVRLPRGIAVTKFLETPPDVCRNEPGASATSGPTRLDGDKAIVCSDVALDGTKDFTADIAITKVPEDAAKAADMLAEPFRTSNFLYSACRYLTITLKPTAKDSQPVSATLAIADPKWVETLALPAKGSITVAPSCGANSNAQDPNLPTALDYVNALATQAKAVRDGLAPKQTGVGGATTQASRPSAPSTKKP